MQKTISQARKGPAPVRLWHLMDAKKDGCPCVIKRRFKYWQTNLQELTKAENKLEETRERRLGKKLTKQFSDLEHRVANRKRWVEFSIATLKNSVRFARARISPGSHDYNVLFNRCPKCLVDSTQLGAQPFVTARLSNGKTELRCKTCCNNYPSEKLTFNRSRRPLGRSNKQLHRTLRYYESVTDSFIVAKKAAAGNSYSEQAMLELLKSAASSIRHFTYKTCRERDDAEQQAIIGLLEAARKFDPANSKLAKFTTYASFWLRRRMQARKTSHCKPGIAIIKGIHKTTGRIDLGDSEEGRADQFHPGAKTINFALQVDMADALEKLDSLQRELLRANAVHRIPLRVLAERHDLPIGKVRLLVKKAKDEMKILLKSHA